MPSRKRELLRFKLLFIIAGTVGGVGLLVTLIWIYLNVSTGWYFITLGMVAFGLLGIFYGLFVSQYRYYKSIPDLDFDAPSAKELKEP